MARLVLGPLLRYVGETDATVWVEADTACEVEVLGCSSRTFRVGNYHYALVHVTGLQQGHAHEYEVRLDGEKVWPEPGSRFPPGVIRPMKNGEAIKLVFGSCRISAPHEPPYTLGHDRDERGLGVDALYATAMELKERPPEELNKDGLYKEVRDAHDAWPVLREFAYRTHRVPDGTRWSYHRDLGNTRLLMIDSRGGRVLEEGRRSMVDAEEWAWVSNKATGGLDHLLIGTSLTATRPRNAPPPELGREVVRGRLGKARRTLG